MTLPITVCIPTYTTDEINRHQLVRNTVARLQQNLHYSGEIRYLISAQGIPIPGGLFDGLDDVTIIAGPAPGFGANLNNLLTSCQTELVFQLDDDIELLRPVDLNAHAKKLMEDETAGWIRLMWIGYHKYTADLDGHYWRVRWDCKEHYVPSCRPHLKHRRFHDYFGPYPEGLLTGETESYFCQICKNKWRETKDGPDMLIPLMELLPDEAWEHMGTESFRVGGF